MEGEGFPSRKQSPVFRGSRRWIPAAPEAERRPARRCGRSRTGFRAPARARGLQAGGAPARNSFMPRQGRQHPGKPVRATPSGRLLDPTGLPSVGGALAPNRRPEGNRAHLRRKGLQAQTPSPRSCRFAAEAAPTGGLFFVGGASAPNGRPGWQRRSSSKGDLPPATPSSSILQGRGGSRSDKDGVWGD
jgi:hypothetical protein